jgi:3',5'-cyclic AMP phosphodiesterase CpdA
LTPFRVVQISDTHLGAERSWFVSNFQAMVGVLSKTRPDLVINTGDISFDGVDREDELAFARTCHARLPVPFRAIPGNHDVGDNPWQDDPAHVITSTRLFRYRRHFGDDHWALEAGLWVLIGLNVQLFGSGLDAEAEEWAFVRSAVSNAGDRPIALFVHKPLFFQDPHETDVSLRYVPPEHRHRLLNLVGRRCRLVASGHVHQHRRHRVDGVDYCWAPSTAFVLPDRRQPPIGTKRVGYVDYVFTEDRVDVSVVERPELTNHDLDDFPAAYDP